jgi:hypothetical protein
MPAVAEAQVERIVEASLEMRGMERTGRRVCRLSIRAFVYIFDWVHVKMM